MILISRPRNGSNKIPVRVLPDGGGGGDPRNLESSAPVTEDCNGRTYGLTTTVKLTKLWKQTDTTGHDGTDYNGKTEMSVVGMTKFFYHQPVSYWLYVTTTL